MHVCVQVVSCISCEYPDVCSRMLTYAHVCSRMLTYADVWQWDYMYECLRHLELGRAAVMPVPHTLRMRSIRYACAPRRRHAGTSYATHALHALYPHTLRKRAAAMLPHMLRMRSHNATSYATHALA